MAKYLEEKYNFIIINLLYLFKHSDDSWRASPKKNYGSQDTDMYMEQSSISTILSNIDDMFDEDLIKKMSEEENDDDFCFEYYQGTIRVL